MESVNITKGNLCVLEADAQIQVDVDAVLSVQPSKELITAVLPLNPS